MPQDGWLLEALKSKIKVPAGMVPDGMCLSGLQMPSSFCVLMWPFLCVRMGWGERERERELVVCCLFLFL